MILGNGSIACLCIFQSLKSFFYLSQLQSTSVAIDKPHDTGSFNGSKFTLTDSCWTLLAALEVSMTSFILGKGEDTDLSLGAGAIRSIQCRRAKPSPSSALEIAV